MTLIRVSQPQPKEPPKTLDTPISKLDFRNRFTLEEKAAIESAADSDITAKVVQKDFDAATKIVLSDPDTVNGINYYVSVGLVTAERANEILTTIPSEGEGI